MQTFLSDSPEDIEPRPLHLFTEQAYLDYAMYVILDRALPHVADGLKPVQRRIVYAMSELGLNAGNKYKKAARTVGDVLGKYHPHGDSACYEAMVLMAQPFSYRYPLVDGQGNWGSMDDPKSFAAMRYTEARLSPFTELLLSEAAQGTVDWEANFDGTLDEPALLPAQVPHVLLNGSTGIAVGMATDIPPHNLREVVSACIHLLKQPDADLTALCKYIHGPDFPTEAELITSRADIRKIYETGNGSLRMRACYLREDGDIIITALPYQTSGAKIVTQIAALMNAKKLPMIEDLRDESDHENPVRLVLVPRSSRINVEEVMTHLFAVTDLERSYRVNMNIIGLDGRPQVKPLLPLLTEWLQFRADTVRRRLQYRLDRITRRLHVLDGLLIAFLNIDEVIHIIRMEDEPKAILILRFNLSDTQAEAIMELRLRHLAKLEEVKIRGEQNELSAERDSLQHTLGSDEVLRDLLIEELQAVTKSHGDKRRSPLVERAQAQAIDEKTLVSSEPVTVILSAKGWVRSAKGHDIDPQNLNYRAGDSLLDVAQGRANQQAVFLDASGRSYSLPVHTLPSARGQGEPLTGRLTPPDGTHFTHVLMSETGKTYLLASDAGYGFIIQMTDLYAKNKAGKVVITLSNEASLLPPLPCSVDENTCYVAITSAGYMGIVRLAELPVLNKGKGVKLLNFPTKTKERIIALTVIQVPCSLVLHSGKRHLTLKPADVEAYRVERNQRGKLLPRGLQKVDRIEIVGVQNR